jgi:hypothetical protein
MPVEDGEPEGCLGGGRRGKGHGLRDKGEEQGVRPPRDEAIEAACDRLEQEVWRRGSAGVECPIFVTGDQVLSPLQERNKSGKEKSRRV